MSPERWQRVEQIYHAALEREPGERAAFLTQDCQGDQDLRREVEALLAQSDSSEGAANLSDEAQLPAGAQLGPYRIESALGAGGMGVVYRARDTKLNRPVAIKLLSQELADAATRRRFQREAQTVSSLNHPHILTVHDAGEFKGRQYL